MSGNPSFKKVYRGNTRPETYLKPGTSSDYPTVRISHDPAFRPENGVVEIDVERIDEVVLALVDLKHQQLAKGDAE